MHPELMAANFPAVGAVRAIRPLPGGHVHRSWLVHGSGGRFVLQRCNTSVFADMDAVMGNVALAAAAICPPLQPLPTRDGSSLWVADDGVWRLSHFLEGTRPPVAADLPALARGLGAFHRLSAAIDAGRLAVTIPHFHDLPWRWQALLAVAARAEGLARDLVERLEATRCTMPAAPVRVAHMDAKPDNFLIDRASGEVRTMIDLDTVMAGSWLWDVGDLARAATSTAAEDECGAFDAGRFAALVHGYVSAVGELLAPDERAGLVIAPVVVTWEQAVRFLTDHLAGDTYYRVDYRGHNLARAEAQVVLLESMRAQESAMITVQ